MTTEGRRREVNPGMRSRRYAAMRRDGFSDEESDYYADYRISGNNIRRMRRARRRFIASLEEEEAKAFWAQMDDYIVDRVKPGEEVEFNIFSPGSDEIEDLEAFWGAMLEGTMRSEPK